MRFAAATCALIVVAVLAGCGGGGGGGGSQSSGASLGQGLVYPTSRIWQDGEPQDNWPYAITDPEQPPGDPGNVWGYMQPSYKPEGLEHVGTDIRTSLGQRIFAVCNGVIEDYIDDPNPYERAIFIKHTLPDGRVFHAVYGHQTMNTGLSIGDNVRAGQEIGRSRDPNNTHLHFGINMQTIDRNAWGRLETGLNPADYGWVAPRSWLISHANS